MMRTKVAIVILLLSLASHSFGAEITGTCYITFFGTSTLHDFIGTVRSRPFTVHFAENPDVGKVIPAVAVDVAVSEIDTDNGKRDKKLRKMFQSDAFPFIHGEMTDIQPDKLRGEMEGSENGDTTIDLKLKIREVEQAIPVRISNFRQYKQKISFDMEFPVSIAAYGLKPPAPLFGIIRVGDRVDVKITFDLEGRAEQIFGDDRKVQGGSADVGVDPQH
jgi:polyisoprenoid-binding protein YceI